MITKLSILIVAFNSEQFIEKCIFSLLKNLPEYGEIIVVDNASKDNTLKKLINFKSKIKLINSDENLGYGKANNLAAKNAKGDYLFIINPDTEIKENIFDDLIKFYENNSDIGIVAPKLVMSDGKVQSSVTKLPTIWGAFKEYILGEKFAYSQYAPNTNLPIKVEVVYGAAFLINKNLFDKLGGFDEKFFLYYEDIDLCRRVKKEGKQIYYYPNVSIIHMVGGTYSNEDKYKLNYQSSLKYHGFLRTFIFQLIFRLHQLIY